ncbi:hypothetical protein TBC1_12475 [Lentimicrobium saccharophilum]|uniref:Uncharacterized protein n=1 Tax=Lentimicrobium saccharophilum TaxID=1678841 RepID=A0A0S7C657_9BACT|nr:hypothetical protein [Lentimicrobium saccharophilum]GAP44664.1 hypothetical protein TBC1_12475 [Lentimicrobium saccharophilum]
MENQNIYPESDVSNQVRIGRGPAAPRIQMNEIIENCLINVGRSDKEKRSENIKYVLGAIKQLKGFKLEDSYLKVDLFPGITTELNFHEKIMDVANGHYSEIIRDPATNHKILVINLLRPRV